jgi:hypothetical protein
LKLATLIFALAFGTAMIVRIIEMSITFDWIDILWAFIFLIATLICGAASAASDDV